MDRWISTSSHPECPLCGSTQCKLVYDLTAARSPDDVSGWVTRCASCAMWFKVTTQPLPLAYPGESGDDEIAETYLLSDAARRVFREALAQLGCGSGGPRRRLLDIGAAQGALLEEALGMGYDAVGIDHCEVNVRAARARGLAVTLAAAEDLDVEETFDVVTMIDFIEHVPNPLRVLRLAHRALKPGGTLIVYTPNHRAAIVLLARLLERAGFTHPVRQIFGRNHVSFFDDRSLRLALHRAGFTLGLMRRFPYDPARPGQYVSPVSLAAVTVVEWLGTPFDRVFRMLAYAQRPLASQV